MARYRYRRRIRGANDLLLNLRPDRVGNVVFTGASGRYQRESDGVLRSVGTDVARTNHYVGSTRTWLLEGQRTNLLLNSATLSTQGVAVTAQAYTLSFYGTGTVTLSGASTAGPLVGTGAADRVSLTFTPTAGTVTFTPSGTVTKAQLEAGAFATSYIETAGAAVGRNAESAYVPWPHAPMEKTVYARFVEQGTRYVSAARLWNLGTNTNPRLIVSAGGSGYVVEHVNAGGSIVSDSLGSFPALGDSVELRVTFKSDGKVQIHQSINAGAEVSGTESAALTPGSAWSGPLHLNYDSSTRHGFTAFRNLMVARGIRTMAEFRGRAA